MIPKAFAKAVATANPWVVLLVFALILTVVYVALWKCPKTRPYKGQLVVLFAICLMALLFFICTYSFKVSKMATGATAATMPRCWCGCLIPVGLLCLKSVLDGSSNPDELFGAHWRQVIIVAVAVFVSVYLFNFIGYYISTSLFLIMLMVMMGEKRPTVLIALPVCWCLFCYFVFVKFLFIALPTGSLFASIF